MSSFLFSLVNDCHLHVSIYWYISLWWGCCCNFVKNFSFSWYGLKNRFLLTDSLSPLGFYILVYLSTVALRFIFIDFSKLSSARSGVNCFRWGWLYYYFTELVDNGNVKSNVFSLWLRNCQLKVELYWYINTDLFITFISISQFGIKEMFQFLFVSEYLSLFALPT